MLWSDALKEVEAIESWGEAEVTATEYDSRTVQPGSAFVAMRGGTTDGNEYIEQAIKRGATAILTDSAVAYERLRRDHPNVPVARIQHGRRALAALTAAVLNHPECQISVSAVTGTNGKTTTAYFLEQLLRSSGRKCILLGTIENRIVDIVRESVHTTPEARDTLQVLAEGVSRGATEAVMEMSSHALDQERVWGIPVDVAIFTNLTQDHLDYHGTMAQYLRAKLRLFEGVGGPPPRVAVINADDPSHNAFQRAASNSKTMLYGTTEAADFRARNIKIRADGTSYEFVTDAGTCTIESPLVGMINVSNLLAASCASLARGLTLDELARCIRGIKPAPGRFQVVPESINTEFSVVVDYAHTDDALTNLMAVARQTAEYGEGRVITVFGCGGDRDRTKRPRMGRAAGIGSDVVILTNDNPRSEDPRRILEDVLVGLRDTNAECVIELDRETAIRTAIGLARRGDIVLIAGKGHERVQIFADRTMPFDDVQVAAKALQELSEVRQ